jgi:polyisoprenoid-binding protein YceI
VIFAQNFTLKEAKVDFKIKNAGFWVNGHFKEVNAELFLEKSDWINAKLIGNVLSGSIETGIKLRDKHLKNDDYFDVEQFPTISMNLLSNNGLKNDTLIGEFNLTIKDIERKIEIPLLIQETKNGVSITGDFSVNRSDVGLGKKSITLSNDVFISFYAMFSKN